MFDKEEIKEGEVINPVVEEKKADRKEEKKEEKKAEKKEDKPVVKSAKKKKGFSKVVEEKILKNGVVKRYFKGHK